MVSIRHHDLIKDMIDSELSIGDQIQFRVVSNSMAPIIEIGNSVVVNVAEVDTIKCGDIIVIKREDDFLTHRAIHSNEDGWLTKGDNSVLFDPLTKAEQIIGSINAIYKGNQPINIQTSRWVRINLAIAKMSGIEANAFAIHPKMRYPFRLGIKVFQRYILWRSY